MKHHNYHQFIFIFMVVIAVSACNMRRSGKEANSTVPASDTIAGNEVVQDDYFSMPDPQEFLAFFNAQALKFKPGIVCSVKKAGQYEEYNLQLLMIGAYSADLAYLTLHHQSDEILSYYSALQLLAEKTKINSSIDQLTLNRVLSNQNNMDSLVEISRHSYLRILAYLLDYDMQNQLAIILYGSFVESLYLAVNYVDNYSANPEIIQKIADQKYAFENLYALQKQYLTIDKNASVLDGLSQLNTFFSSLPIVESGETPKPAATDGLLVIGNNKQVKMDEDQFNKLKLLVINLHNNFVQ